MKDAYKKLAAKYKLPDFDTLNEEFDLYTIEHTDFLLKNIAKQMTEKLDGYAKFLEELSHPETNIAIMRMASALEPEDKKTLTRISRRLQYWMMSAVQVDLAYDEKTAAKYVADLDTEWRTLKIDLLRIMLKLRDSWKVEKKEWNDTGYLG
jgi:hypothetical protein